MTRPDMQDVIGAAGLGLFVAGIAHFSIAVASMVLGLLLFAYAWVTSGGRRDRKPDEGTDGGEV